MCAENSPFKLRRLHFISYFNNDTAVLKFSQFYELQNLLAYQDQENFVKILYGTN
jgi:hypothetical protein